MFLLLLLAVVLIDGSYSSGLESCDMDLSQLFMARFKPGKLWYNGMLCNIRLPGRCPTVFCNCLYSF